MDNENNKSFNDLVEEKIKKKKRIINKRIIMVSVLSAFLFISSVVMIFKTKNVDNDDNNIKVNCHGFKMVGILNYKIDTKNLYIDSVNNCGNNDKTLYDKVEAIMYENGDKPIEISTFVVQNKITINDYLKQLSIEEEDYLEKCSQYNDETLYLEVTTNKKEHERKFKVGLSLGDSCSNK